VFPIFLNLTGKLVVVVGGGAVGARKLAAILESGAAVRLVDPRPLANLSPQVQHIAEEYRAEHLDGAALVLACAPPEVNLRVVADAGARGVWANVATSPECGDFALPAVVRRGEFVLAVGTGGAAPALARRVREKLEAEFDSAFAEWVRVLGEVRRTVLATVGDESRRRELLDGFADWSWLARLRTEGADAVLTAMREIVCSARGA
jgi:precorrin-2 dehydrogenase/sirohydrochlorin ferrochelatase